LDNWYLTGLYGKNAGESVIKMGLKLFFGQTAWRFMGGFGCRQRWFVDGGIYDLSR